jgi:hypothetical protein
MPPGVVSVSLAAKPGSRSPEAPVSVLPPRRPTPIPCFAAALLALVVAAPTSAQQVPDTTFAPPAPSPAFAPGAGPVVLIDEGHHDFHTLGERFAAFDSAEVRVVEGWVRDDGALLLVADHMPFGGAAAELAAAASWCSARRRCSRRSWPDPSAGRWA